MEAGYEPARVVAIDTVDGEAIATLKLLHFNTVVVGVMRAAELLSTARPHACMRVERAFSGAS